MVQAYAMAERPSGLLTTLHKFENSAVIEPYHPHSVRKSLNRNHGLSLTLRRGKSAPCFVIDPYAALVAAYRKVAVLQGHGSTGISRQGTYGDISGMATDAYGINLHGVSEFSHEAEGYLHLLAGIIGQGE